MKEQNWKRCFSPKILERGETYCNQGKIENLMFDDKTGELTADVYGTEIYQVHIVLTSDRKMPTEMECDCAYAEDGEACKHIYAIIRKEIWDMFKN